MLDKEKIKAVLWDLDDTLYSRVAAARQTFPGMFKTLLYPDRPAEFIKEAVAFMMQNVRSNSMVHEDAFRALFAVYPPDRSYVREDCLAYYSEHLLEFAAPYPGALRILGELRRRGIKTALVTNITKERVAAQRRKIDVLGIAPLFDEILISGEVGFHKPDRRIFDLAASRLGVKNGECLFVGDDLTLDVLGALGADMEVVWLDIWGRGAGAVTDPRVHRVLHIEEYFVLS